MTARLARTTTLALALSAMTLNAHAGVVTTLLAVPWGLIHLVAIKISEPSTPAAPAAKSTPAAKAAPADAGLNHWVFRSSGPSKLPPVLALAQLHKDFGDAIRAKVPTATITIGAIAIPAAERAASSGVTTSGWLACEEPVYEARAQGEKNQRLHVCVTHSEAGFQTAVYAFDPERRSRFATLPFTREAPAAEFIADPEGQAGTLAQQLKAALEKTLGPTELIQSGGPSPSRPAPIAPARPGATGLSHGP